MRFVRKRGAKLFNYLKHYEFERALSNFQKKYEGATALSTFHKISYILRLSWIYLKNSYGGFMFLLKQTLARIQLNFIHLIKSFKLNKYPHDSNKPRSVQEIAGAR